MGVHCFTQNHGAKSAGTSSAMIMHEPEIFDFCMIVDP